MLARFFLLATATIGSLSISGPGVCAQPDTVLIGIETDLGTFEVELYGGQAPLTVANFLRYVDAGHYEGGTFFRTVTLDNQPNNDVKIEVVQAGTHPWQDNFAFDPIPLERTSETGVRHVDGAISMARGDPNSATSSFFVCIGDQPELDFGGKRNPDGQGFAAFGRVVSGMDVVRRIHQSDARGQALVPQIGIIRIERLDL
jgi:peptidyl-prolyl cis-trans isomerase A (cyclophilin A)